MRLTIISIITLIMIFYLFSCSENKVIASKEIVFPDSLVSYINHVKPFIDVTCSYQGCHSDETMETFSMTNYFSLRARAGLIIPGNSTGSTLIQILEGTLPHKYYYLWQNEVTANQKKGLRKWIDEGALDN